MADKSVLEKFPFEPPWEDLKMVVKSGSATAYIFDTFCKDFDEEKKREVDQRISEIYYQHLRQKALKEMQKEVSAI